MATTSKFIMTRDINGYNGFGLTPSNVKYSATLSSGGGEKTFTVPSDAENYLVVFSIQPGADIWIAYDETAATPVGATFASTTSELNPVARKVSAGTIIHAVTADSSAGIGVMIYAI